jgi:alpha-tubulin suppressor-like RCC1 family protein
MSTVRSSSLLLLCCTLAAACPLACGVTDPTWPGDGGTHVQGDAGASLDAGGDGGDSGDGGTDAGIVTTGPFAISMTSPTPLATDTAVFTVTDCGATAAVLINEGDIPSKTDAGWQTCVIAPNTTTLQVNYKFATGGLHQLRIWARDAQGNIFDIPPLLDVVRGSMFSVGDSHSCALVAGRVQCWGDNSFGQLGIGSPDPVSPVPVTVPGFENGVWEIAGSSHSTHTCAIKAGAVSCWGRNDSGQLGNPTVTQPCHAGSTIACSRSPVPVLDATGQPLTNVTSVAANGAQTCALKADQSIYCWGDSSFGELGVAADSITSFAVKAATPASAFSADLKVTQLSLGTTTTCGLTSAGWQCVGMDFTNNQPPDFGPASALIGRGGDSTCRYGYQCRLNPVLPAPLLNQTVSGLAVGFYHSCALVQGKAVCWGANHLGQYGDSTMTPKPNGTMVPLSGATDYVISGAHHSCARLAGGAVACWGLNDFGQLGGVSTDSCAFQAACSQKPILVNGLKGVAGMAAGRRQTCAAAHGQVLCWGGNDTNELGATGSDNCPDPSGLPQACSRTPLVVPGVGLPQ